MLLVRPSCRVGRRRSGLILPLVALIAPALVGMIGLVVDAGLLMAAQRQAQNAADAAAMAAAMEKFRGSSDSTALTAAQTFLNSNGLSSVTLTLNGGSNNALNIPPQDPDNTGSPYKSNSSYVEVILTKTVTTLFIQVLGVNSSQQVKVRAVAGYEAVGAGEGVMVLDPTAAPGLDVSSNVSNNNFVRLLVNGDITVNSQGGGVDQYGATVSSSYNQDAVKTQNPTLSVAPIVATNLQVAGGVTNVDNIRYYDSSYTNNYDPSNGDRPIIARAPRAPDPLISLATPMTSNGVVYNSSSSTPFPGLSNGTIAYNSTTPQAITIGTGDNVTFLPGIYQSIKITGGTATFNSGIYVLGINQNGNGGTALDINGGTVTGNGVLFYNTGGTYTLPKNQGSGTWDSTNGWSPTNGGADANDTSDTGSTPPGNLSVNFGGITINGAVSGSASVTLSSYNNASNSSDPFNGIVLYQRRKNTQTASIGGNASSTNITGTLYAKWANFQLAGTGNFNAQFIVGSMSITGQATVTINAAGKNLGKANLVFLVE
jgi:Flp pilus assembly protein TadG